MGYPRRFVRNRLQAIDSFAAVPSCPMIADRRSRCSLSPRVLVSRLARPRRRASRDAAWSHHPAPNRQSPTGKASCAVRPAGSSAFDLVPGKRYVRLPDPAAEALGFARVVDESGEDYVYPLAGVAVPDRGGDRGRGPGGAVVSALEQLLHANARARRRAGRCLAPWRRRGHRAQRLTALASRGSRWPCTRRR